MNNLNFLREEPPLNWLDYFVDRKKFDKFLKSEKSDSKQFSALANQFTEQAMSIDKECDTLVRKEYDEEDLAYNRCKSAQLWICALSCFASVNWNLDLMKQCCNIISMKALLNRLIEFCYPTKAINSNDDILLVLSELHAESKVEFEKPEQLFACWLYATWLLKVDVDGRFPETIAKPTVSNPLNQFDANLMQAEQFKNCTAELRRCVESAEKLLKRILENNRKVHMIIPTKDCFLEALSKEPNLTIDSILNSGNMSTASIPVLNFQMSNMRLDHNGLTLTVLYSLMCSHFAAGKVHEARNDLERIVKNWPKCKKGLMNNVVLGINENDLAGYCEAYCITHSFYNSIPRFENELMFEAVSEKALDILDNCSLVHRLECQRVACTSESALMNDILAENIVSEYNNDFPATLNTLTKLAANKPALSHLITICLRLMKRRTKSQVMKEVIQFLCTKIPNFAEEFKNVSPDCAKECLGNFNDISRRPIHPLPNVATIKEFLNGGTDVWRLIVSFDMNEIKSLFAKMTGKMTVPHRFRISRMIGDVMSAAASQVNFEHINLLLGKLEQLAVIGDGAQWRTFCNDCVKEMGPLGKIQEIQVRFAFDAVRVQLECWHARFSRVSNNAQFVHVTQALNSTVKALIQSSMTSPVTMGKMMLHTVTFFINTSEWDFLLRSFVKVKSPFLDAAKMIAAYMTSTDPAVARQIVEGPWWHVMNSTFQEYPSSSKRRNDGSLVREQAKQLLTRTQFLDMLRLIKEYRTISFLISFLAKMFGAAGNTKVRKESDGLMSGQDINKDIFVEHPDYWQSSFEKKGSDDEISFNLTFLIECLDTVFKNALIVNPINAFWLRSYADFCFACDKFADALVLYMEACVACSDSLMRPLPDNVVDDVASSPILIVLLVAKMWLKVQRCLRISGAETLSVLICQLMRNPIERYVPTASSLMETHGDTLDACTAYFPLISDINLAEFMSDVYEKLHLHKKEQLLLRAISVPEINSHNMSQLERFRRRERFLLVLFSRYIITIIGTLDTQNEKVMIIDK
ncbi:Integrator complex subunit [Dirofilaria immitis]